MMQSILPCRAWNQVFAPSLDGISTESDVWRPRKSVGGISSVGRAAVRAAGYGSLRAATGDVLKGETTKSSSTTRCFTK